MQLFVLLELTTVSAMYFSTSCVLAGIIAVCLFIRYNRRRNRLLRYVRHLPAPPSYPLVGSILPFIGKSSEGVMEEMGKLMSRYKTPFYGWFIGCLVVVLDDPDDVNTVLSSKSCLEKPFFHKFLNVEDSLLTAPVNVWKVHRKALNKAFNPKSLQSFLPIFREKVKYLVRNIGEKVDDDYFDISPFIHACTLDMVCATTMGAEIEAQNGKNADFVEALGKFLDGFLSRALNPFYYIKFIYENSPHSREQRRQIEIVHRLPREMIAKKKEEFLKTNQSGKADSTPEIGEDDDRDYETPQIFINELFKLQQKGMMDDKEMRDEVFLMISAGTDTSAIAVSFTILLLAMHPRIQERAFEEVDRVLRDLSPDDQLTLEHINELKFIEQIIRESLRLGPPAPNIGRECWEDTKIRDCVLPRGTTVIFNLFSMHRREDMYGPTANVFDPDRFHPDEMQKRNPYAFAPFSLGPRNCIGYRYANMAMKIILANLLRNFRFTTNLKMSDIRFRYGITMKNASGNMVRVQRREFIK